MRRTAVVILAVSSLAFALDRSGRISEARIRFADVEQLLGLGELLGELDICTRGEDVFGEYFVINADAVQLEWLHRAGVCVEVTWPDIRDKFRFITGVDPDDLDGGRDFGYYFTYWEIQDTLQRLADRFPSICRRYSLGRSFQNRDIWCLKISDNPGLDEEEPALFVNGATHAREPTGTHCCVMFAVRLLQGYGTDSLITWLVNNREVYIVPVMNPDGYVYNSDSGGASSNWRKNRRGPVPPYVGIDLNRNYGYKWGYDNIGSSPDPSAETYRGPARFSEVETQVIRDFQSRYRFRTCQDFHTYGRYNMYPWGYVTSLPPEQTLLQEIVDTFRMNNGYPAGNTGQISRVLYTVNGGSVDWEYSDTAGKFVTYAFTCELSINDFWYGWNDSAFIRDECNRNIPNLLYLARISGVFFDPVIVVVNDTPAGNQTAQLDPAETGNIWFTVRNRAIHPLDSAYAITGRLRSLHPQVLVLDSLKQFPRALRRGSTSNGASQFRVFAMPSILPGTVVPLRLELSWTEDGRSYSQPVSFSIVIGNNPIDYPDVGVTAIVSPRGVVDSGQSVVPVCSVYNYGNATVSYRVRMRIGSEYNDTARVSGHAPGTYRLVQFPSWQTVTRGWKAVTCSTELTSDADPQNDRRTGSVIVRVTDIEAVAFVAPGEYADSGIAVAPAIAVRNNGFEPATFLVRLDIEGGYSFTDTFRNLVPDIVDTVIFPTWIPPFRGSFRMFFIALLTGDQVPQNDTLAGVVRVRVHDAGVRQILSPAGSIEPGLVVPQALVRNFGTQREPVSVTFVIDAEPEYRQTLELPEGLPAGIDTTIVFPAWQATVGSYTARCSTAMAADLTNENDT
ncbi:MAG: M14 family zinc carboxypeptidase, partial [candidate division WOR-3 bacterium]